MTYRHLTLEYDGALARLTLNRPDQANALGLVLAEELCAALAEAETRADCHVLLLQGSGRFFCAGGDVAAMAAAADQSGFLKELAGKLHEAVMALVKSRLISIAVVNGPAAGAGLGLVLNSDFILASPRARFLSAYAGVGLTPDCGVSYLLPELAGPRRAAEMCLTGRVANHAEALEWGLINEVAAAEDLAGRAEELGRQLAAGAVAVLGPTKRLLRARSLAGYEAHLQEEAETIASMADSADTRERLAVFAARSST
ncbi:enoyl-CoA hydratase/isomerase family protein [Arthrobacter sp. APC 3897]|uniref:enoyl-CoA hydratase/isomerase family protein n=1 Tax=Arthrobacter sp. APC 3897 TaxID=3035204 RepID=UPI0025B35B72|nr:enoyl-CoA hydratase/isomerase family protein [Arthrobacter sp. APC 3897]MDN3480355.1 enoyl-CoA hydratase/isomerase family protein [Arthrobacter sp. APC 3897]